MFLAVGVLHLSVVIGIAFAVFSSYVSLTHLAFAIAATITLQYVSIRMKKEGLNIQLVGLAWLAAALVILTPILG